jgi:hypothetical protein
LARAAAAAARTFPDDGAVATYGADRWNAYVEGLPPSHREALRDYSIEPGPDTPNMPTLWVPERRLAADLLLHTRWRRGMIRPWRCS